ncbi:CLUMA_CG004640, isoform A [Clunio marinus]|uniref:CLUMA_CG004640, isoform A n=1 Tax=Clunio marinus TaxID=568069 RepID=A0A1J1HSB9_9DIPT|nr:CLUMA_CG004640, isoform A [Clunio marinus]
MSDMCGWMYHHHFYIVNMVEDDFVSWSVLLCFHKFRNSVVKVFSPQFERLSLFICGWHSKVNGTKFDIASNSLINVLSHQSRAKGNICKLHLKIITGFSVPRVSELNNKSLSYLVENMETENKEEISCIVKAHSTQGSIKLQLHHHSTN